MLHRFRRRWSELTFSLCATLVLLLQPIGASADAELGSVLKPDLRLLIDISGSMKDSDPDSLRAPALELMVRLLPEGAKAGVKVGAFLVVGGILAFAVSVWGLLTGKIDIFNYL